MILIGLGSNIIGPWGTPRETVSRAIEMLGHKPLKLVASSALIETTPLGKVDQPPYINAVARIETRLQPLDLLATLREIERHAGRERRERWGARTLDLDILDYDGLVLEPKASQSSDAVLVLPHPSISEREFVLAPIAELAPRWRHPVSGASAREMLMQLSPGDDGRIIKP